MIKTTTDSNIVVVNAYFSPATEKNLTKTVEATLALCNSFFLKHHISYGVAKQALAVRFD